MSTASTSIRTPRKIIPIFPERRYKSLEYSVKRLIAIRTRATFSEVVNFILQLKHRRTLGDFGIQPNKLNRRKLSQVLQCLCREKKVIRKRRYFEHPDPQKVRVTELVRRKATVILLVGSPEAGTGAEAAKPRATQTRNRQTPVLARQEPRPPRRVSRPLPLFCGRPGRTPRHPHDLRSQRQPPESMDSLSPKSYDPWRSGLLLPDPNFSGRVRRGRTRAVSLTLEMVSCARAEAKLNSVG